MFNNFGLKAKIVKNNEINCVHDDDLEKLLKSLGVYDDVISERYNCLFCQKTITIDNLDSIVPHEGKIQFTCDKDECHKKLLGWQ